MELNIKDSQNFLHNKKLVAKLIEDSNINENDLVYEIGGGKGIITQELARNCNKVITIEYDPILSKELSNKFGNVSNVDIVCKDFLSYQISDTDCKFFSNIPFNITADIFNKVLQLKNVSDIYFIMQYEAFLKYAGMPYYKECLKSLQYKPFYDSTILYEFSPKDFKPAPNAKIILAHFFRKSNPDISIENITLYQNFLTYVFAVKGSTIKEKLKNIFSYEQIKRASKSGGFKKESSVSELNYNQWLLLFDIYLKYVSQDKKDFVDNTCNKFTAQQKKIKKIHRNRNYRGRDFSGKRGFN